MAFPFLLTVAYAGTDFFGFQIQSTLRTVQGELWKALRALDAEAPMPHGTGRTDAGVHARAQGVLALCSKEWEPHRLLTAMNAHLPKDVRVMAVEPAPEAFHPRHHAVAKRYVYRISEGVAEDPLTRGLRWHIFGKSALDREAMRVAASHLLGEHDFRAFRSSECVASTTVRRIHNLRLEGDEGILDLIFEGDRFLMHQVRIMSGTLVEVGKGKRAPEDVPRVLLSLDRTQAGATAPPQGLCMEKVWYQAKWGLGDLCPWGERDSEP
jgi:tRNA pseudouridine38-40 synthase